MRIRITRQFGRASKIEEQFLCFDQGIYLREKAFPPKKTYAGENLKDFLFFNDLP